MKKNKFIVILSVVSIILSLLLTSYSCNLKETETDFIVMTFNIRVDTSEFDENNKWDNRKDLVVQVISDNNPDLLGLQESMTHQLIILKQT